MSAVEREHHAPLDQRLEALAQQFYERAWKDGAESIPALREYLRDHAASLTEFARQVREEYERTVGDEVIPRTRRASRSRGSCGRRSGTRRSARRCRAGPRDCPTTTCSSGSPTATKAGSRRTVG